MTKKLVTRPADKQRSLKTKQNEKREGNVSLLCHCKRGGCSSLGSAWTKKKVNTRDVDSDSGPLGPCQHISVDHRFPPKGSAPDTHGEARVGGEI